MKKILLNLLGITVLLVCYKTSQANFLPGNDSTSGGVVNSYLSKVENTNGFVNASQLKEKTGSELKKFIFSIAVTPRFKTTVPPVNLYFEHGIAGLASLGVSLGALYDSESDLDYHAATISLGARGCGYVFPVISKISGGEINNYGFQPYVGLVYDYYITATSISEEDIDPVKTSKFGVCAGTRWYPGKRKFALLGEYNSNGIGNNIKLGISFGR